MASSELRSGFLMSIRPLCHDTPGTLIQLNSASTTVLVAGLEVVSALSSDHQATHSQNKSEPCSWRYIT